MIIDAFFKGLKNINGDISISISSEIKRFYKLITSDYLEKMRNLIDSLHKELLSQLDNKIFFTISCRQKSWESTLRKILKYYFEGRSLNLYDLVALRITIDSNLSEEKQEEICNKLSNICILFFKKQFCLLIPPAKLVGNDPLLKNYILFPKENGYKSIHLAFMDVDNTIFEVQIRTEEMDINAEYGPKDDNNNELNHTNYKDSEYEDIINYIFFDMQKANRPLFRTFWRTNQLTKQKELKLKDKIGLVKAKHVEECAHTF